jgi:hypothetical protein
VPYIIETERPAHPAFDDRLAAERYAVVDVEAVVDAVPSFSEADLRDLSAFDSVAVQRGDKTYIVTFAPRTQLSHEAGLTSREASFMDVGMVVRHFNHAMMDRA